MLATTSSESKTNKRFIFLSPRNVNSEIFVSSFGGYDDRVDNTLDCRDHLLSNGVTFLYSTNITNKARESSRGFYLYPDILTKLMTNVKANILSGQVWFSKLLFISFPEVYTTIAHGFASR